MGVNTFDKLKIIPQEFTLKHHASFVLRKTLLQIMGSASFWLNFINSFLAPFQDFP